MKKESIWPTVVLIYAVVAPLAYILGRKEMGGWQLFWMVIFSPFAAAVLVALGYSALLLALVALAKGGEFLDAFHEALRRRKGN